MTFISPLVTEQHLHHQLEVRLADFPGASAEVET
jgi:hypothetical protein